MNFFFISEEGNVVNSDSLDFNFEFKLKVKSDFTNDSSIIEFKCFDKDGSFSGNSNSDFFKIDVHLDFDISSLDVEPVFPLYGDYTEHVVELSDDLCFSNGVVVFPYESESVDLSFNFKLVFSTYILEVVVLLYLEFKDKSVSVFFDLDNVDMIVVIPVCNSNIVIKMELEFEFIDHLGKSDG